jgi:hypothetical protein
LTCDGDETKENDAVNVARTSEKKKLDLYLNQALHQTREEKLGEEKFVP